MKTYVLGCLVALLAITSFAALRDDGRYTFVDLGPLENFKLNAVKKSPTGHVTLGGVPFQILPQRGALQTKGLYAEGPNVFRIPAEIRRPTEIYILLNGGYVKPEFAGKKVGEVVAQFKNGKEQTFPIIAWKTLRETWSYDDKIVKPDSEGNPKLINVYSEAQNRGRPAKAFLDMYVIKLEHEEGADELSAIEVRDLSEETVHDICPALIISGVTVKHD